MKYIDKFATLDDFFTSDLGQMSGDRIATIEGYELPILKKKMKTVITIDPSTNQEVETEELQDVGMVPVGQEEKKVEHNFEVLPYKKIFYFTTGSGVKDYTLCFTPSEINNVFKDNNISLGLDYSKVGSSGTNWDASSIGRFSIEKFGNTYTSLNSSLKDAIYPTDGQTLDVPFFLKYDGSWKEFKCHATFEEFDINNVVVSDYMTLSPGSTIEIGPSAAVGTGKIVQSTGNSDLDKFSVSDITYTTAQGNDALTYNSQYITLPSTQHSCGYDIQGTVTLKPFILDDAMSSGSVVEGNYITMPLSLHVNVLASGDIPFEFNTWHASATYQEPVESGDVITFELDLNETQDRDLSSYTVTGNSLLVSSYVGTTGGKVLVTMTIPNNVESGVEYSTGDTITISNSRGYSHNFSVTYNYVGKAQDSNAVLVLGTMTDISDNSTTLNIANGTAGNAGASSKNFKLVCWNTDGNGNIITVNGSQYQTIDVNDVSVSVSSNPSGAGYSVQKLSNSIDVYFGDQNTSSNNADKSVEYTITFTYGELSLSYTVDVEWCVIITENEPDRSSDGQGYRGNKTIKKVIVSEGVTYIGESAFNGCTNLTSVSFPSSLEYIGMGAFIGTAISSIILPSGFKGMNSAANLGELGYGTFMNCYSLTSIYIPDGIKKIGASCFSNCNHLQSIELPYGCTYANNTFSQCPAGDHITYRSAPSA